jgi:hypothetical protein
VLQVLCADSSAQAFTHAPDHALVTLLRAVSGGRWAVGRDGGSRTAACGVRLRCEHTGASCPELGGAPLRAASAPSACPTRRTGSRDPGAARRRRRR